MNAPVIALTPAPPSLAPDFLARGCTFVPEDRRVLASHWHPVARACDIADQPVAVRLLDLDLVVYRTPGGVHVARDLCPHRGVPLRMGCVEGDELVCAYHGLRYGPDGRCRRIPAQPDLNLRHASA